MNKIIRHSITCILSFCLIIGTFIMEPARINYAESMGLNFQSLTLLKGQYGCVLLRRGDSSSGIKWSVSGKTIKIVRREKIGTGEGCYIKVIGKGSSILKCTVGKQIFKCKVKGVDSAKYIGDFVDFSPDKEIHLSIWKCGKNYLGFYGQFRLYDISHLGGKVKNGTLTLKKTNTKKNPLTFTVEKKGKRYILTWKKTGDYNYLKQGSKVELKRCSGKEGYKGNVYNSHLDLFHEGL